MNIGLFPALFCALVCTISCVTMLGCSVPTLRIARNEAIDADQSLGQSQSEELVDGPTPKANDVAQASFIEDETSFRDLMQQDGPNELDGQAETIQVTSLSLDQLEAIAISSHPDIIQARARVEAARGQYIQSGLPPNPIAQYQSQEIGNDNSTGIHTLGVSQMYVTGNKLGVAQQVQAQRIRQQQAAARTAELRVLTQLRARYAETLIAQRRVELTEQIHELAQRSVTTVDELLDAEEVSKIVLLQARVEAEQAKIAAENAATQLAAARKSLAAAVGETELQSDILEGNVDDLLTDQPWEKLFDEILAANPQMEASRAGLERARWALQLACLQNIPNVTGQVAVGVDTSTDDTFASLGVSVPIPVRNRNQGNIRTARANINAANAAIKSQRLTIAQRWASAMSRYDTALQRYRRLRERIIPDAEDTFELSRQAFEAGEVNYLQFLTVQRTLFATRLSVLDSIQTARQTQAEIAGLLVNDF